MLNKKVNPPVQVYRYARSTIKPAVIKPIRRKIPYVRHILFILILITISIYGLNFYQLRYNQAPISTKKVYSSATTTNLYCSTNMLPKLIVVSINSRHLWACSGKKVVHSAPVITGNMNLASDLTPIGNYKIFDKIANYDIIGTNGIDTWNDHVNYWMPFLKNGYGTYGFHDATWRPQTDFGNIDPKSKTASHGCVELPTATSAFIYEWAPIGTDVSIVT